MVKGEVLSRLIDANKAAILRAVLRTKEEFYLTEIAAKSDVPLTSTFRILQEFVDLGILSKRQWKTSKVYSCQQNDKVDFLRELLQEETDASQEFVKAIEHLSGIQQIFQHGERSKQKANIILIGEYINNNRVEEVCQELRGRGLDISFVTFTTEQYAQLHRMGMYAGEKKVLK